MTKLDISSETGELLCFKCGNLAYYVSAPPDIPKYGFCSNCAENAGLVGILAELAGWVKIDD